MRAREVRCPRPFHFSCSSAIPTYLREGSKQAPASSMAPTMSCGPASPWRMYKRVEMPPPRALSSSPHMLDIDLLDLSTACSLPEPVQRYGSLLFAHSATRAGSFTAAPGGAKEGRATTATKDWRRKHWGRVRDGR